MKNRLYISRSSAFRYILIIITFSVLFKIIEAAIGIPISALLVSYVISIVLIVIFMKSSIRIEGNISRILLYTLFIYYIFTNCYTISLESAKEKTLFLIYADLVPLLIINLFFLFSNNPSKDIFQGQEKLYRISACIIFILFVLYTIGFTESIGNRHMIKGMLNPIWAGRVYAFLSLLVTYYILAYKRYNIINILAVILGIFLVYTAGTRGPLFAYAIITTLIMWKYSNKVVLLSVLSVFILIIMLIIENRGVGAHSSNLGRLDYLYFVLDYWNKTFLGYGIGSFGNLYLNKDVIFYPHNLILELYIEGGIPLFAIIIVLFLNFFINFRMNYISISVIFFMINSMLSGDITSNNFLFIFLFLNSYIQDNKEQQKLYN
ncbi:MAG: O-antigen ligase family protein [Oceanivirga sp.]|nr:O-antigen ligase family protein [Oceanivirga sp.]